MATLGPVSGASGPQVLSSDMTSFNPVQGQMSGEESEVFTEQEVDPWRKAVHSPTSLADDVVPRAESGDDAEPRVEAAIDAEHVKGLVEVIMIIRIHLRHHSFLPTLCRYLD